jgi:hypothetical protein
LRSYRFGSSPEGPEREGQSSIKGGEYQALTVMTSPPDSIKHGAKSSEPAYTRNGGWDRRLFLRYCELIESFEESKPDLIKVWQMLSYQELEKVLKEITNVYDAFALTKLKICSVKLLKIYAVSQGAIAPF